MSDEQLRVQIAALHEALAIYGSPDNWDFITRDRFTYNDWPELGPTVWGYIEAEKVLSNTAESARQHDREVARKALEDAVKACEAGTCKKACMHESCHALQQGADRIRELSNVRAERPEEKI